MNVEMHKAIKLLNTHSLSVVSTPRQMKNGTIMVMDDFFGDKFTIHSTGYARKRVQGWTGLNHYQLNKVTKEKERSHVFNGKTYTHMARERILLPGKYMELAEMVIKKANRDRIQNDEMEKNRPIFYKSNKEIEEEYLQHFGSKKSQIRNK